MSNYLDVKPISLADTLPERLLKVYPYELINTNKSKTFIKENSTAIATISQKNFNDSNMLTIDDDGNYYFEMVAAITSQGVLDVSAGTSTYGVELKEEDSFIGLSNFYYEGELNKIKIGNFRFMPAVFFIGEPYNKEKYESGEQPAFIPQTMIEAQSGSARSIIDIDPEGLYEFVITNITTIEQSFRNSKIKFTTNEDISKNITNNLNNPGISIEVDGGSLLGSLKLKGTKEKNGITSKSFVDIDLISEQHLTPFKATPIDTEDKVTIFADWFDFDTVLPWGYINRFLDGAKLEDALKVDNSHDYTYIEDINLVKNMLTISYLYASQFNDIPLVVKADVDHGTFDKSQLGKIRPDYAIGTSAIPIENLAGKDPIKAVDGLYEEHIRKHPSFLTNHTRYQPIQGIINALSRYINSTHTIGKGNNAYGWAYLPWFLMPKSGISLKTTNYTQNGFTKIIKLNDNQKFIGKSLYFNKYFNSGNGNTGINKILSRSDENLIVAENVNVSNPVLLQTDRKLTLPQVPYQIMPLQKLPLPGDINTQSSQDLKYLWYLPISDNTVAQKIYLKDLNIETGGGEVTQPTFTIPRTDNGVLWTGSEVSNWIKARYPGDTIIEFPEIQEETSESITYNANNIPALTTAGVGYATTPAPFPVNLGGHIVTIRSWYWLKNQDVEHITNEMIFKAFGPNIIIEHNDLRVHTTCNHPDIYKVSCRSTTHTIHGSLTIKWKYNTFTEGQVTHTNRHITKSFGFNDRRTLFDNLEWEDFLTGFGIERRPTLDFKIEDGYSIKKVDEIIISSLFSKRFVLSIGGESISIPSINQEDETITTQKILFT